MRLSMRSFAIAAAILAATPAVATDVASGTVVLSAATPTQLGRLTRDGVQSDWSEQKAFPGITNATTSYAYRAISVTFAPNALQDVYYDITIDDPNVTGFVSAYNGVYDPANKATNYLGDPGASGNPFPGDTRFFDVIVPKGGTLTLVFNQTAASYPNLDFAVYAFSDTEFNENFQSAAVPEPATWGMMILGFGAVGASLRRRSRAKPTIAFG